MSYKDENKNLIPDKADKWVAAAVVLVNAVLIGVAQAIDPTPKWVTVALGILVMLASSFKFGFLSMPNLNVKPPKETHDDG